MLCFEFKFNFIIIQSEPIIQIFVWNIILEL